VELKKYTSDDIRTFVSAPLFDETILIKKDSSWPKISIVTPSYNQAEFLERTILSILNQNYPNLEYIIIDGNSSDESVKIIEKYQKYLTYWVSEPDKGQADALNKGFRKATGDLVAWQNSDDVYLMGALKKIAQEWKQRRGVDIFFGNIYLINKEDNILKEMRFIPFSVDHLIVYDWNLSSQAVFWKRSVFDIGGFLEDSYEVLFDWDWFIRLGLLKLKFSFIKNFLGAYRIHDKSKLSIILRDERKALKKEIKEKNRVKNHNNVRLFIIKQIIFMRRVFYYIVQGDFAYLYDGVLRRIRRSDKLES
jgi:glycosyltransferase involved in cell wall biosynthesis